MEAVIVSSVATVVFLAITIMARRQVRRLRSLPWLTPNQAGHGAHREALLYGSAQPVDPEQPAPLSGIPSLLARAYETDHKTRYDAEGNPQTSTRTREISRVDTRFAVVDPAPPHGWVMVDSRQLSTTDLTPTPVQSAGGTRQFGSVRVGRGNNRSEERLQRDQHVWLIGRLVPLPTGGFSLDGKVELWSREPSTSTTGVRIFGTLTVLGALATLAAAGLTLV